MIFSSVNTRIIREDPADAKVLGTVFVRQRQGVFNLMLRELAHDPSWYSNQTSANLLIC